MGFLPDAWSAYLDQAGPTPQHTIKLASMCSLPSSVFPGCYGEKKGKPNLEPALRVLRCGEKLPDWPRWALITLCLCLALCSRSWPPGTSTQTQALQMRGCISSVGGRRKGRGGREWLWCFWPVLQQVSLSTALLCLQPRDSGSRRTHTSTPAADPGYLLTGLLTVCHPSGNMFLEREDLVCLRHCCEHPASRTRLVHSRGSACFVDWINEWTREWNYKPM